MMGHARWLLWEGFSEGYSKHPETYSALEKGLMYFISCFKYGHEAVFLFFVLSGFVIHLRYSKLIAEKGAAASFDFPNYLLRRIRRIYPPLLLAMIATYALDSFGKSLGYAIYHGKAHYASIASNVESVTNANALAGNLLFLVDITCPAWGTNAPLWSLTYEWWFYMAYPLLFFITKHNWKLAAGLVFAFSFSTIVLIEFWAGVPFRGIANGLFTWWIGALLADIYTGRIKLPWRYVLLLSPLAVIIPVGFMGKINGAFYTTLTGLGFAGIIATCFWLQEQNLKLIILNRLKWLGDISYSLYVGHLPLLVLLSGWLMSRNEAGLLPQTQFWILPGIAITLAYAYFSYQIAEKPFIAKRK